MRLRWGVDGTSVENRLSTSGIGNPVDRVARSGGKRRLYCRSSQNEEENVETRKSSGHQCGLVEAARYVKQDAMLVTAAAQNMDERARSDLTLLARGFSRLDMRARQDMALIGTAVTKLDARAREKAERKVGRFGRMATKVKEIAGTELKLAAEEHWNDGGLEADLRLADIRARRRAMEDSFVTFQAVKNIHNAATRILLMKAKSQNSERETSLSAQSDGAQSVMDRIAEFEDAYLSLASLVAESNVLEQSDPDEIEFIIATLLDMDEVQGATGSSLVTETASSPDTATRRALVNALANAPSLWALGNAGLSALQVNFHAESLLKLHASFGVAYVQRLAQDENPEVSKAATKALDELADQWKQIVSNGGSDYSLRDEEKTSPDEQDNHQEQ